MRVVLILIFLSTFIKAQRDTCISLPLVGIHLSAHLPGGDMVNRYGASMMIGGSFQYKTNKNWLFGAEFSYMYGKTVKEDVMKQLKTPEGYVVDNAGNPADLRITERGAVYRVTAGKLIRVFGSNKNSGLVINVGAGFLQHKINLYDAQQKMAAIKGELKYGYDRLCFGFSMSQFVGYMYISKNHLANFYVGIESIQGWTQSLRKINYDTGLSDTKKRTDVLTGLRFGWILPLYKKQVNDFYYN